MSALRKIGIGLGVLAEDLPEEYIEDYAGAEVAMNDEYAAEVTPIRPEYSRVAAPPSDLRRITTIHPRSYNDARLIGEAFRGGVPVIMNLTDMDDADAKRLVDFSAGLIFGLHGAIERVTNKVFLLSPEHIEILGEEEVEAAHGAPGAQFYNQS
ncbi:MAG: cell division protein SepF [Cellulomonadaceae bacterium]|jgi:cell division inhibitor SepF|nr:cell division protein SepF [Cellulomonadaceae bacterium]